MPTPNLERKFSDAENELEKLRGDIAVLENALASAEFQAEEAWREVEAYRKELGAFQELLEDVHNKWNAAEGRIVQLQLEIEELKEELHEQQTATRWVSKGSLLECLATEECSGVHPHAPLIMWPAGKMTFTYKESLIPRLERNLDEVLTEFEDLFGLTFIKKEGTTDLEFLMTVGGCLGDLGCTRDSFLDFTKTESKIYIGEGKAGTIRHELIHAITPIGHSTRTGVMTEFYKRPQLTDMDKELVRFFFTHPDVGPGITVAEVSE